MTRSAMDDHERILIERACERLVAEYTHLIDHGNASQVADLFTPTGTWSTPEVTMTGIDEIRAGFGHRESMQRISRHVCTNLVLRVIDDAQVDGVVYLTLYRADTDAAIAPLDRPTLVGAYHDSFVRTEDGWRFQTRSLEVSFA